MASPSRDDFYQYRAHQIVASESPGPLQLQLKVRYGGQGALLRGEGKDLVRATIDALGWASEIVFCKIHQGRSSGANGSAVAVEISLRGGSTFLGIGPGDDAIAATVMAVMNAVNRALRQGALDDSMRRAAIAD